MCRSKMTFFHKLSYVDAVFRRFLLASCVGVLSEQIFPRRIGRARLESANLEPDRRFGLLFAASECTSTQNVDFVMPAGSACVFGFKMTAPLRPAPPRSAPFGVVGGRFEFVTAKLT